MGKSHSTQSYGLIATAEEEEDLVARLRNHQGDTCPPADGSDIVQFSASSYFVTEVEGTAKVEILRFGSLKGTCAVDYQTVDDSGVAGLRYVATSGRAIFRDGEFSHAIEVPIVCSEFWSATLEFGVVLLNARSCILGSYLGACSVKVIDDDLFPANSFAAAIKQGEPAIVQLNGFALFASYCRLNLTVPGVASRTVLILLFDQLQNAYRFLLLAMGVYIVDTVFKLDDPESQDRLILQTRKGTAVVLGVLYIAPMFVLHMWEIIKIKLDLEGISVMYLQSNLVRKYLNFSDRSREEILPADMQDAILSLASTVALVYSAALSLARLMGKLFVLLLFTFRHNPTAAKLVLLMPSLMLAFGSCRSKKLQDRSFRAGSKYAALLEVVQELCNFQKYRLIANYFQRPRICEQFNKRVADNLTMQQPAKLVRMNNDMFTKWLGPMFVGWYCAREAQRVIDGDMSLGTFLATTGIFQQLSVDFGEGYSEVMRVLQAFMPLKRLTFFLNMETDVHKSMEVAGEKHVITSQALRQLAASQSQGGVTTKYPADMIALAFHNIAFASPTGKNFNVHVDFQVPQGSIVAIKGNHGSGKSTLMRLIAHEIFPTSGSLFIPSFLRILHVSQECILLNDSPWNNLIFGIKDAESVDPDRVEALLKKLKAKKLLQLISDDLAHARGHLGQSEVVCNNSEHDDLCSSLVIGCCESGSERPLGSVSCSWHNMLSYTEKVKLHLARAFLMNAEVMVMQRPMHHFDQRTGVDILRIIHEHSRCRGVAMPATKHHVERPRTVFLTTESSEQDELADYVFDVSAKVLKENPTPRFPEPRNGSKTDDVARNRSDDCDWHD